jgi:hypothetical protein
LSFEAKDLSVKVFSAEHDGLWAMGCGGCDSTAPKPGCQPPSRPCNPPSHPGCPPPSKKAGAMDPRTADLSALRQQLQTAISAAG